MTDGFGRWQFSDELPTVKKFAEKYRGRDYSSEGFNPWRLLYGHGYEEMHPQDFPSVDDGDSDDCFDEELGTNSPSETRDNRFSDQLASKFENLEQHLVVSEKLMTVGLRDEGTKEEQSIQQVGLPVLGTNDQRASQLDESDLMPNISLKETEEKCDALKKPGNLAVMVELLDDGAKELDLTTLPTASVVQIFHQINDAGLCHAVESVCSMKHTEQARFNSLVVTHLLLPRLQESQPRCNRQVQTAFCQFLASAPVLNCRLLLIPLLVNITAQHTDLIRKLLTQVKTQQQKDIVLKGIVEGLSVLGESHLSLLLLVIGPTGDNHMKQQFLNLLVNSSGNFSKDIKFGKLLLALIPHYVTQPELKEQLVYLVNHHQSLVKRSALKLLNSSRHLCT